MRSRLLALLALLLLLASCSPQPSSSQMSVSSDVEAIRVSMKAAGVDVLCVTVWERPDKWDRSAKRTDILFSDQNERASSAVNLYEFATEEEAARAARGEQPDGPQDYCTSWIGEPYLFRRGKLVAIFVPALHGQHTSGQSQAVFDMLKTDMGKAIPQSEWERWDR